MQAEIHELSALLFKAGALRVNEAGTMLEGYSGEAHDGVLALRELSKRITLRSKLASDQLFFDNSNKVKPFSPVKCITSKSEFQNQTVNDKAQLFFKSGGSSGKTTYSYFSYEDYHAQMSFAAKGLLAAGLNPVEDRVMNLFFGGGLYGGFLSFYTILEKLNTKQFPMAGYDDFDYIASVIIEKNVNVLIGMPSFLIQILKANIDKFKEAKVIEKIYFGGEPFSIQQRIWLQSEFGIETIKSASYGSVDAGPLGYQCKYNKGSVHHMHDDLHGFNLIKMDSLEEVGDGEVGRLIVSTYHREALKVVNYDIGDIGRWVIDGNHCLCGSKSRRFELLGRFGDIF